jgi:SAM-dependent methyltransferase
LIFDRITPSIGYEGARGRGVRELRCAICGQVDDVLILYRSTLPAHTVKVDPYAAHYQINRCRRCELVYSSPIFDDVEVAGLYMNSLHGNVAGGEEVNARRTMALYYDLVKPHLPGRRRILDVGCDVGFLLDVARGDGFGDLYGIEPNPVARAAAAELPGARISSRFYEEQDFPDDHFDFIALVHVLDHLVDPRRVLERARRHLRPHGVILVVVHDVRSLLARVMGERFPPYNLYHHYFFSKTTLSRLVEFGGFEPVWVGRTYNCYSIRFLVTKAPAVPALIKRAALSIFKRLGVDSRPVTLPLGNIAIVARRPVGERNTPSAKLVCDQGRQ